MMQIKDLILSEVKSHPISQRSDAPTGSENLTQHENVKRYLESMNMITPYYALNVYGAFRLSAIIYELRKEGLDIITEMVTSKGKSFACYMLKARYDELKTQTDT
tara:strand:- start:3523 stop:3837 length:315 start_codon:yes stop_codon:yes gene_type:complete